MPAKFQRNGVQCINRFYVYWVVVDDDESILKWFKDAANAAHWAFYNGIKGVEMRLRDSHLPTIKTED